MAIWHFSARDSLRIAYLNHADPGRIQYLTNKVKQLEAQLMMRNYEGFLK